MSFGQMLVYSIGVFALGIPWIIGLLPPVDAAARFTQHPPSVLYVQTGKTARFVWDYTVDNRNREFSLNSPEWAVYDSNNKRAIIGSEYGLNGWKWTISSQCPSRLLNPTVRVSKESTATLVITSVTTADSGIYECRLVLTTASPITSKVQLVVTDTKPRFTQFPPRVLYVSRGETARFVWNYHVDDRKQKFTSESPRWSFIDQSGSESTLGADDKYTNNWDFVINRATCPPRLLNPDRVSRKLPATLVITNVSTADNGIYKCTLMLKAGNPINHQVQLVVTVSPTFLSNHPERSYQIIEGQDSKINCTAIGPPTPNITWVNVTNGSIKSQGSGNAVMSFNNIQRYHAGVYECQAQEQSKRGCKSNQDDYSNLFSYWRKLWS